MPEYDIATALAPAPGANARKPANADYRALARAISQVLNAAIEIQKAMRVVALGIDFRQFGRFKKLAPSILYFADFRIERRFRPGYVPISPDFEFCRQFVITAALRVAEES